MVRDTLLEGQDLNFVYEASLLEHMQKKGMTTIAVEVMSSTNSDFEVTELYVHLIKDKQAEYFKQKKRFRGIPTEHGEVLLPPYRLEYDDTVCFGLKEFLFFRTIRYTGIRL